MSSHVKQDVLAVIEILENPPLLDEVEKYDMGYEEEDEAYLSAYDYLTDALEATYHVNEYREYLGARVMVAFGGPTIWIDTWKRQVEGQWWGESFIESYSDNIGLNDACEDMFNSN